ncbi:MAG: SUMF1/EgtB/PvdO family nonheme iron enzyme [Gallionella sp.]
MKEKSWFLLFGFLWLMPLWAMADEPPISGSAQVGKRVALVIGNDSYEKIKGLENARADARAMAVALEKLGFDVILATDVNHKSMLEAVRRFKMKLSGGDEAVFYFSGHGVQLVSGNYLLPVDVASENEEQVHDDALPLQRVLDDLQEQKTRFSLAVIDACRDNPFKTGNGRSIGGRGLASTSPANGQMVIYSAGAGQKALDKLDDKDKDPNGLFTRIFLKEMAKPNVPIGQVLQNVREQVVYLAKGVGQDQFPALFDQSLGTFYFSQVAVPVEAEAALSAPAVTTTLLAPVVLANVPQSTAFSLEAVKQRQASQVKLQAEMQAAFDETLALNAAPALQVAAWQIFLNAYAQDNPFSTEDEHLRGQAEARKKMAEKQIADSQAVQATQVASLHVTTPASTQTPAVSPQAVVQQPSQIVVPSKMTADSRPAASPVSSVIAPVVTTPAVESSTPVIASVIVVTPATPPVAPAMDPVVLTQSTVTAVAAPAMAATQVPPASPLADAAVIPQTIQTVEPSVSLQAAAPPLVLAMVQPTEAVRPVESASRILANFRDCPDCAEMVALAPGRFMMGSPSSEQGRFGNEKQHEVTIAQSFAISKYEVTFAEWDACVAGGGCGGYRPDDEGWGRGKQPVIQISWEDAKNYVAWLSQKTGKPYRLPTDAEWEYAARAGTTTSYPWGELPSHNQANYGADACCAGLVSEQDAWEGASPVGSFPANAFGLHDMQGNVWEWVEDCSDAACTQRGLRGGSWNSYPSLLRSANRNENIITKRPTNYGFRIAITLP